MTGFLNPKWSECKIIFRKMTYLHLRYGLIHLGAIGVWLKLGFRWGVELLKVKRAASDLL